MPPDRVIPEALAELGTEIGFAATTAYAALWSSATNALLGRSATPPAEPADWRIGCNIDCDCEHCAKLRAFCADPVARTERFPLRQELRRHLHGVIDANRLDMLHETERRGRPYTLVCTKNRASYERRLVEYAEDVRWMRSLADSAPDGDRSRKRQVQLARLRRTVAANDG